MKGGKAMSQTGHVSKQAFEEGFFENRMVPFFDDHHKAKFVFDYIKQDIDRAYELYLNTPDGQIRIRYAALEAIYQEQLDLEELDRLYAEAYPVESSRNFPTTEEEFSERFVVERLIPNGYSINFALFIISRVHAALHTCYEIYKNVDKGGTKNYAFDVLEEKINFEALEKEYHDLELDLEK